MKFLYFLLFSLLSLCNIFSQEQPKLVVAVVIDQMKAEYLDRFYNDFEDNGFKKLLKNGYHYKNTHYNYLPTYTAPGHASIYTGTTPIQHGIIGNDWYIKNLKKERYCTEDNEVQLLGNGDDNEGKMSPRALLATTITDELKLNTNFKSKVIGISLKDRGAILPAGHFADWAFWYSKTGSFISSNYYAENLPQWVTDFNTEKNYEKYITKPWTLLKPKEIYNESLTDNNPYEGKLYKKAPFFPYDLQQMYENNDAGILRTTPFGNNLLLDFALRAIEKENLGKDNITDFISISFSSTDYIGHVLGPRSIEIQDTYLRLDNTIAQLLSYLDKNIGHDKYLLFLTADHAGAENVTYLKENKYVVNNILSKNIEQDLKDISNKIFNENIIEYYSNFNIFLDENIINKKNITSVQIENFIKECCKLNYISAIYTKQQIITSNHNNDILNKISNGYSLKESGDLVLVFNPGYVEYSGLGTTHGSPYNYDTHVPLIFYGNNIKHGQSFTNKDITQIAATLSFILKTPMPNCANPNVLEEILDKK